jgi:hypothetical protein
MKHYKAPDNAIYAYELDGSQDHLISADFIAITEEEAQVIIKAEQEKILQELIDKMPNKTEVIANLEAQLTALKEST